MGLIFLRAFVFPLAPTRTTSPISSVIVPAAEFPQPVDSRKYITASSTGHFNTYIRLAIPMIFQPFRPIIFLYYHYVLLKTITL